jgi:hypothetical protein
MIERFIAFMLFVLIFGCSTTSKYYDVPEEKYEKAKVKRNYSLNEDVFKLGFDEGDQLMDVLFLKFSLNNKFKLINIHGRIHTRIDTEESISNAVLYLGMKKDDTFIIDKIIGSTDINGVFNVSFKYKKNTVLIFYFVSFMPVIYDLDKFV